MTSPSAGAPAASSAAAGAPKRAPAAALSSSDFARLFRELSEPDQYFFSNNYVSNETSYLQVADELAKRARKGGAYLGVGPEQNFTYIALTEPELAFLIDIRRANAVEQLLYKAAFDRATDRVHFLALLLGRPFEEKNAAGADASIEQVLARVERTPPDRQLFEATLRGFEERIRVDYQVKLGTTDSKTLEDTARAFFDRQLELRFELLEANGRAYPSLRELLSAKSPSGAALGFLASERGFRTVQRLQREHRIVPVVGDFAGDQAMARVAAELARRDLPVSVFYVSNVEQYLMEPPKWAAWVRNVNALPSNEQSLFVRAYLDQGRRHPAELPGHRTATVLMPFDHFKWRQRTRGYGSFWQLATDGPG